MTKDQIKQANERIKQGDGQALSYGRDIFQPLIDKAAKMLVQSPLFKLILPVEVLRKMNKKQYKETMSWLRKCRRIVNDSSPVSESIKAAANKACYGSGVFYA